MTEQRQPICKTIEAAFRGVCLGEGVGLNEAQGLDDYADQLTLQSLRETDEKEDWSRISTINLNRCSSSLSFFDAEGMRFHIPAFLIAELRGEFDHDLCILLSTVTEFEYAAKQFALLSSEQRDAIRIFLAHMATQFEYQFERSDILKSLNEFWTAPGQI